MDNYSPERSRMTAAPKPDPTGVAAAWSRVIELSDAGSPPAKRAAARAHAEALTRRWKLSLGEQAAQGRNETEARDAA